MAKGNMRKPAAWLPHIVIAAINLILYVLSLFNILPK